MPENGSNAVTTWLTVADISATPDRANMPTFRACRCCPTCTCISHVHPERMYMSRHMYMSACMHMRARRSGALSPRYPGADGSDVGGEVLGPAERVDVRGGLRQRRGVVLHHVDAAQERQDRQAGGMAGGAAGGAHGGGGGQVVAPRDPGGRGAEHR